MSSFLASAFLCVWAYCLWLRTKASGSSNFIFFEQETNSSTGSSRSSWVGFFFFFTCIIYFGLGDGVLWLEVCHPDEQAMWNGWGMVTLMKMLLGGQINNVFSLYHLLLLLLWDRRGKWRTFLIYLLYKKTFNKYSHLDFQPLPLVHFLELCAESWYGNLEDLFKFCKVSFDDFS